MSDYVQLAALKATLGITGTGYDTDLTAAISAASRVIDERTGRRFYPDADANQQRKFLPLNPGYCVIDDLCQFTSLDAQDSSWTLDQDFYLEPLNAAADGRPYTAIRTIARPFIFTLAELTAGWAGFDGRITVTGMWGWASTPPAITEAAGILATRYFKRSREAPFGIVGLGADVQAIRLGHTDPDVAEMVAPYSRTVIA